MSVVTRIGPVALACAAWIGLVTAAPAQEDAAPAPAQSEPEAPPKPKPRPKPRPKPKPKPVEKTVEKPAEKPVETQPPESAPVVRAESPGVAPAAPAATNFAAPPVVCEPGQAVHYQGAKAGVELWATRSGAITLDNPLRPLTPDVTRVLQVVVGGKVATAYGPDWLSLRRGGSPATLEGTLGGKIQWEASLPALPDTLPINAETGEALAELRFRDCGTAPTAKLLPPPKARRTAPSAEAVAAEAEKAAEKRAAKPAAKPRRTKAAAQPAAEGGEPTPPALPPPRAPAPHLPQGAIP